MKLSEISLDHHEVSPHDYFGNLIVAASPEGKEVLVCKDAMRLELEGAGALWNYEFLRNATAEDVERLGVK